MSVSPNDDLDFGDVTDPYEDDNDPNPFYDEDEEDEIELLTES